MVSVSPNWGVSKAGVRSGYSIWGAACSLYILAQKSSLSMCDCAGSPFRRCRFSYVNFSRQEHDLVQILVRRSWCPGASSIGVLAWSCTGPCEKIVWRSCWKPPQESLALRSWRCSALVLVWNSSGMLTGSSCIKLFFAGLLKLSEMS